MGVRYRHRVRVLHLSWEYPPLVYGGLGRHVAAITAAQVAAGDEVTVLTQTEDEPGVDEVGGVRVVRVRRHGPELEFGGDAIVDWVAGLESALSQAAGDLAADYSPDVLHAHDWMVVNTALAAQQAFDKPLVATIHATEAGRHQGWLPNDLSRELHQREWLLSNSANRVITCSAAMKREAEHLFDLPTDRTAVVPNGIDLSAWNLIPTDRDAARTAHAGDGPLLVQTGRLEWEKGVDLTLAAVPLLQQQFPGVKLVIAGRGTMTEQFKDRAAEAGLGDAVEFLGWMPDHELRGLIAAADTVIVPSRYEPFGLVALEAAALGAPVVVADTGGLTEIADNGRVALTFPRNDAEGLAAAVTRVLTDSNVTQQRNKTAQQALVETYPWTRVAALTEQVYRDAATDFADRGVHQVTAPEPPPAGTQVLDLDN